MTSSFQDGGVIYVSSDIQIKIFSSISPISTSLNILNLQLLIKYCHNLSISSVANILISSLSIFSICINEQNLLFKYSGLFLLMTIMQQEYLHYRRAWRQPIMASTKIISHNSLPYNLLLSSSNNTREASRLHNSIIFQTAIICCKTSSRLFYLSPGKTY